MRRNTSAFERGTMPGCLLDDPAQAFLHSPTGEGLSKAVLKDQGGGLGEWLWAKLQFLRYGFEQGQNALLASFALQAGRAWAVPNQCPAAGVAKPRRCGRRCDRENSRANGPAVHLESGDRWRSKWLGLPAPTGAGSGAVKALERNGQHLAGQGQCFGRLLET